MASLSLRPPLVPASASGLTRVLLVARTHRPELASDQALIQAALARVKQEKVRPFVPTVSLRGVGSQTPGLAGNHPGEPINPDSSSREAGRWR